VHQSHLSAPSGIDAIRGVVFIPVSPVAIVSSIFGRLVADRGRRRHRVLGERLEECVDDLLAAPVGQICAEVRGQVRNDLG